MSFMNWLPIKGYENLYKISDTGEIRSLDRIVKNAYIQGKKLKLSLSKDSKYLRVTLSKGGKSKSFLVHRLVAETFIPNPNEYKEIEHLNNDTLNNDMFNLKWVKEKENVN